MDRLWTALKSRTVWTAIAVVIINGVPAIRESIPADWLPLIDGILGIAAVYFRVNQRQDLRPVQTAD